MQLSDIMEELQVYIFNYLDVGSQLKMRCVSKVWYNRFQTILNQRIAVFQENEEVNQQLEKLVKSNHSDHSEELKYLKAILDSTGHSFKSFYRDACDIEACKEIELKKYSVKRGYWDYFSSRLFYYGHISFFTNIRSLDLPKNGVLTLCGIQSQKIPKVIFSDRLLKNEYSKFIILKCGIAEFCFPKPLDSCSEIIFRSCLNLRKIDCEKTNTHFSLSIGLVLKNLPALEAFPECFYDMDNCPRIILQGLSKEFKIDVQKLLGIKHLKSIHIDNDMLSILGGNRILSDLKHKEQTIYIYENGSDTPHLEI